ncbi:MAG TPA: DinB family protein [Jatrophihabitans sp.]|jgi:hypothetical protein|uniref:DinB family protein n=1 Tax=Jatrophihabitans sp. TaxID=1932789 RepID=UPI002E0A8997|nr:DinB family protein [Jatrophihabitans sp.]
MAEPTTPPADVKDWTWAITEPCPDCGFDPASVTPGQVPALTRRHATSVRAAVLGPGATTRARADVWSPLEYGCHVRDVCLLFAQRLDLMLTEDDPRFANWDQDETALEAKYWTQDPTAVADQLAAAADSIASAFATVEDGQWSRPGRRSNGSVFTVDTFARYFLHDLAHHAWDVRA